MNNDGPLLNMRWVPFRPAANVGAFEVVQANGAEIVGGIAVLDTIQPNGNGTTFLINGPADVGANTIGMATLAMEYPVFAAYNSGNGTPAFGETWGPASGSSVLNKSAAGFKVIYPHTNNRVLVLRELGQSSGYGAVYNSSNTVGTGAAKVVLANTGTCTADITLDSGGLLFAGAGTYMVAAAISVSDDTTGSVNEICIELRDESATLIAGTAFKSHVHAADANTGLPALDGHCSIPMTPVTVNAAAHVYLYANSSVSSLGIDYAALSAFRLR